MGRRFKALLTRNSISLAKQRASNKYLSAATLTTRYACLAEATSAQSTPCSSPRPLALSEYQVSSQNGEDGILCELLCRLGTGVGSFAEIGASDGAECNLAFLADWMGWQGWLVEGCLPLYERLRAKYGDASEVKAVCRWVLPSNVNGLFGSEGISPDIDVLSIDIDGLDLWVWLALEAANPKVVVIEYNAALGAHERIAVDPKTFVKWDGHSIVYGASIGALVEVARKKGYSLVHTDQAGVNAFFIRDDLKPLFPETNQPRIRGVNHFLSSVEPSKPPMWRKHFVTVDLS